MRSTNLTETSITSQNETENAEFAITSSWSAAPLDATQSQNKQENEIEKTTSVNSDTTEEVLSSLPQFTNVSG